jgi:hypothetical protein
MKGRTDKVELPCPLPFAEYNMNMGAIDDFDCLLSFLSVRLRSRKWWHAIFYFLIDTATINALHLWRQHNADEAEEQSRRVWVGALIEEIIHKFGDREGCKWTEGIEEEEVEDWNEDDERPAKKPAGRGGSHQGMARCSEVLAGEARLTGRHFPWKRLNRGICVLCYHTRKDKEGQKQVMWMCEQCKVMLHVPECFKEWHTKKNPKSQMV